MASNKENTPNSFDSHVESEREKTHRRMFSKVSHDLRTPLSLIIGSLEIYERMKDKFTEEKKNTLIQLAIQESYRLDNFITNILDMENLENKMVTPKKEPLSIKALIEDCIKNPHVRLQDSNIKITKAIQEFTINSDNTLLCRVITLLLDNVIKYAANNASVLIECSTENNNAIIKIHDNGPGIPELHKENIFEKYSKIDTISKRSNASSGLGLTICREIMTLLGGKITAANSNTYSGAVFTLSLPL